MTEAWVPDACTLPTVERPVRIAEFQGLADVTRSSVRHSPTRLTAELEPAPGLADEVRHLTRRESECCSFFGFVVREEPGRVLLDIDVPEPHAEVLDGLARLLGR
ncbi:hypothetical protein GCU60_04120 [Blastococcus saxobsidens]|uniref:Arsenate reductase n=1 Tax=Blastococcus saxobsidens TaxID=138336 RepID=A0A6L9W0G4_9ACTN|nr:hypothetical protein [Blastococcus saxobsidens]NEK84950.1 hypothetical protein [Blastococcus saxobsidens]